MSKSLFFNPILPLVIFCFFIFSCSEDKVDRESVSAQIWFVNSTVSAVEGETVTVLIETSMPLANDAYLELAFDGTAQEDLDYTIYGQKQILIRKGETGASFTVLLLADKSIEADEKITIAFAKIHSYDDVSILNSSIEINIKDNDEPAYLILENILQPYIVDNRDTTLNYTFKFNRFVKSSSEVEISISGDVVEGEDYKLITPNLMSLESGTRSINVEIELYANDANELDEKLILTAKIKSGIDVQIDQQISDYFTVLEDNSYAGYYKVIESTYVRIGVERPQDSWVGQMRFIGPGNSANRYAYHDYWGPFEWDNKYFEFQIDPVDLSIDVPIADELFYGDYIITCTDNSDLFVNVPCDGSNVFVEDPVNGKHRIYLTYGYYYDNLTSADSGPREFYEVLERL